MSLTPLGSLLLAVVVMFFAGVGMSADLRMLGLGGKALAVFLVVLFPYILVQDAVGVGVATLLDLHPIFGLVGGSITLVGGHGTGAAYAERLAEVNNLQAVMELSMTVATIGLIVGGIIGGPVAQYLATRYRLRSAAATEEGVGERFSGGAVTIPAFLWCMMLGVAIRNLAPFARIRTDDRAADLISGVSLSPFLVMTMMALDLVEVAASAGPFLLILVAQVVFIVLYAVFVCFRFMGRDYEAGVTSAAFIGFNLGSTATAMANMQAITAKYGPAPRSHLNAFVLTLLLALPFMGG